MPHDAMFAELREALTSSWRVRARPEQLMPAGDWYAWLLLTGRGWGKTRTAAEAVQEMVTDGRAKRVALVGATASDVRDTMIEGESGLLAIAPAGARPEYEPSKRRLTWPNGAIATAFSAEEPERLRGPQHDLAWCDELAAWSRPEAWAMLQLGLRLGKHPRAIVSTTPKPVRIIRELLAREGKDVIVTRGATWDNAANLAPTFMEAIQARYGGTRLGRQELEGAYLDDVEGALWRRRWIDDARVTSAPDLQRVIIAIDPAVSNNEGSDLTGIVAAGVSDGHFYVLEDATGRYGPQEWATRASNLYRKWRADKIVAEVNNGGQLVEATLRMVDANLPYKQVHASRGKAIRAEPCSALYEQGRVHHVGDGLAEVEDQMCAFTSDFDRSRAGYSPDRVDALVWALTELSETGRRMIRFSPEAIALLGRRDRFADPYAPTRGHNLGRTPF